jgi:hypothetical protein
MKWRERPPRDRGVALLVVITWLAMMIALVAQFTFGTTVEAAQAANARDELRAHYMARSGINLSRLLIKIQSKFVEPIMGQAQKMMQSMTGTPAGGAQGSAPGAQAATGLGISLRVTDYADLLMGFFSGSKEEVASLGSLIGLDIKEAKGLGLKNGRFDAEITAEDGKIDINCGGGYGGSDDKARQLTVFRLLSGLMFSPRYDRLFSTQDQRGQFSSRADVARALIDWADDGDQLFSPDGASGTEDYGYDAQKDKYHAHNARFDTLEEIKQVRGVSDEFLEAFGPYLTVYPTTDSKVGVAAAKCRLNLSTVTNRMGGDCAPLMMGIIRATAIGDPTKLAAVDPTILDDAKLYPIVTILCDRASAAGFDSLETVIKVAAKPEASIMQDDPRYRVLQGMKPLTIDRAALDLITYVGPARTYRIVATGESGKVRKKITAIVDTGKLVENPLSLNPQSEQAAGVIQYWREE